jgi:hypothetical protein
VAVGSKPLSVNAEGTANMRSKREAQERRYSKPRGMLNLNGINRRGVLNVYVLRFGCWGAKEGQYHIRKEVVRLRQEIYE